MNPRNRNKILLVGLMAAVLIATGTSNAMAFFGWGGWWGYSPCYSYSYSCYSPCYSYSYSCYSPCYSCCWDPCCCYCCWNDPDAAGGDNDDGAADTNSDSPTANRGGGMNVDQSRGSMVSTSLARNRGARKMSEAGSGTITVSVPEDAKVFINGGPTTITGTQRAYVSRNLEPGRRYKYVISAQVVRGGKSLKAVKEVYLVGGESERVAIDFTAKTDIQVASAR